ncbi:MAG: hypothetical protein KIT58_03525 [Planctomycetota bacterium]|nr:hypothetical protein [Planctomycetota bacterium]
MDSLARDILKHLEGGPSSIRALLKSHPRSSLYRRLRELMQEGLIERDRGKYRLLPAGRGAITRRSTETAAKSVIGLAAFHEHIPALRHAPTRVHQAVLALVCCAMVARSHRMRTSHHPGLVLFGPAMRWKTWVARSACLMAGIDPERFVVQLATESGRSLFLRKGATGERRSTRTALEQPVVGLDEYLRATPEVRRLVQALLCGELTIPDENELLDLRAVPLILLNPREGDHLSERVGLDGPMLRRTVCVDLGRIEIPAEIVAEGDTRLAKIAALPRVELREPRCPEWDPQDEVRRRLQRALADRSLLGGIDLSMLSMLAAAATAWLSPAPALDAVLDSYLTAVETLGWLHPDWRERVDEDRHERTQVSGPPDDVPGRPGVELDLDYLQRLERISAACARQGLSPETVAHQAEALDRLQQLGVEWDDLERVLRLLRGEQVAGATPAKWLEQLERCGSLVKAEAELLERVKRLEEQAVGAARHLESTRLQLEQAVSTARAALYSDPSRGVVALGQALRIEQVDAESVASYLLQELAGLLASEPKLPDLGACLSAVASRAGANARVQDELVRLRARATKARRELAALEAALERRRAELQRLGGARRPSPTPLHPFGGPWFGPRG